MNPSLSLGFSSKSGQRGNLSPPGLSCDVGSLLLDTVKYLTQLFNSVDLWLYHVWITKFRQHCLNGVN